MHRSAKNMHVVIARKALGHLRPQKGTAFGSCFSKRFYRYNDEGLHGSPAHTWKADELLLCKSEGTYRSRPAQYQSILLQIRFSSSEKSLQTCD